jgi:hypothetical protein
MKIIFDKNGVKVKSIAFFGTFGSKEVNLSYSYNEFSKRLDGIDITVSAVDAVFSDEVLKSIELDCKCKVAVKSKKINNLVESGGISSGTYIGEYVSPRYKKRYLIYLVGDSYVICATHGSHYARKTISDKKYNRIKKWVLKKYSFPVELQTVIKDGVAQFSIHKGSFWDFFVIGSAKNDFKTYANVNKIRNPITVVLGNILKK